MTVPAWLLVQRADVGGMLLGYALIGVPLGVLALSAFLAELFPTHIRYTGLSLTYGVASALAGGTAPLAAAFLVQRTGNLQTPGWYAMAATGREL